MTARRLLAALMVSTLALLLGSCESSGSGYRGTSMGVSYYGGSRWHDPYYRRRCCYYPSRPPSYRPGRPVHLPARPVGPRPTPMPSRRR